MSKCTAIKSQSEYRARKGFYDLAFNTWKMYSATYRTSDAGIKERKWLSDELQILRAWENSKGMHEVRAYASPNMNREYSFN